MQEWNGRGSNIQLLTALAMVPASRPVKQMPLRKRCDTKLMSSRLPRGPCGGPYRRATLLMASRNTRRSSGTKHRPTTLAKRVNAPLQLCKMGWCMVTSLSPLTPNNRHFCPHCRRARCACRNNLATPSCCVHPQLTHPLEPNTPQRWWWSAFMKRKLRLIYHRPQKRWLCTAVRASARGFGSMFGFAAVGLGCVARPPELGVLCAAHPA